MSVVLHLHLGVETHQHLECFLASVHLTKKTVKTLICVNLNYVMQAHNSQQQSIETRLITRATYNENA